MTRPPTHGPEPTDGDAPDIAAPEAALGDDELAVHAVLEGDATENQHQLVASRSDLVAHLDALRIVRARLAVPPADLDAAVADAHVARALEAVAGDATSPTAEATDAVTPLRRRPPRPERRSSSVRWLVAAVAVVVVALGAVVATSLSDRPTDDTASVADDAASPDEASNEAPGAGAAERDAPSPAGPEAAAESGPSSATAPLDLGAVADLDGLRDAARNALGTEPVDAANRALDSFAVDAPLPCESELTTTVGEVLLAARARLDGRDVVVLVSTTTTTDPETIRVLTADTCELIFVGPL